MKRLIQINFLVVTILLISACASHRYTVLEPGSKKLTDYQTLEIRDFTTTLGDADSRLLAEKFADRLYQDVMQSREEHPEKIVFKNVVRSTKETKGVLLLDGTIVSFEKGSRAT